jgi:predicted nucleic acid-binding protein
VSTSFTEIELLSNSPLDAASEAQIRELLKTVTIVGIREDVVGETIGLRRRHGLKLPDAIIAGTALSIGAELITNDQKFFKVTELPSRQIRIN